MPSSIQEAFAKAVAKTQAHITQPIPAEWDDETTNAAITEVHTMKQERVYFQTTNNVTRETFNFVRDNPGLTRVNITDQLATRGFKKSSTTSLLGQMLKQGLVRESAGGLLYANQQEYSPIKASAIRKSKLKAKPVVEKAPSKSEKKFAHAVPSNTFDAEKFVGEMTVVQAKAVYDYLRTVFGG